VEFGLRGSHGPVSSQAGSKERCSSLRIMPWQSWMVT